MKMEQITNHIYMMRDLEGSVASNAFLIIGNEKAILIDSMNGNELIKPIIKQVTDLPVNLIHTHGHCDHIGGDGEFGEAYIDPKDMEVAKIHWEEVQQERIKQGKEREEEIKWKPFLPGACIDLGGYILETYEVPGHTPGGLCFLNREERILITGDAVTEHIWMQLWESQPLEILIQSLQALDSIRDEFDTIYNGHAEGAVAVSVIDKLICGVREILDGNTKMDHTYTCFDELFKAHPLHSDNPDHLIVYAESEDKKYKMG